MFLQFWYTVQCFSRVQLTSVRLYFRIRQVVTLYLLLCIGRYYYFYKQRSGPVLALNHLKREL